MPPRQGPRSAQQITAVYGIIGYPVGHSLSPAMHTAAFRALGLDALYAAFAVPPRFLRPMLRGLVLAGIRGLNVTVPLKEAVLPLMDALDESARAIGAVNTIVVRKQRLTGYNTDAAGVREALRELGWKGGAGTVVILGAGGAARAAAWELSRGRGRKLWIGNRHPERAAALARWLRRRRSSAAIRAARLADLPLEEADLLINATSIGMRAGDGTPVDLRRLRRDAMVYDMVYHRPTALVRAAVRGGHTASGGESMLLHQGAASFRLWTGRRAPLSVMRAALTRGLAAA